MKLRFNYDARDRASALVELDGHNLTNSLQGIDISASVSDGPPTVTLHTLAIEQTTEIDVDAITVIERVYLVKGNADPNLKSVVAELVEERAVEE